MQRYFARDIKDNKVILTDEDKHHIKNVMRMKIGDEIEVVYQKQLYLAKISNMTNFEVDIIEEKKQKNDKIPKIILIIPALKEQKMDLILQKGTEIGVSSFIIAPYERSIIKYDERKEKVKLARWKKICKEASEQSMRLDIPSINIEKNMTFVDKIDGLKLICSTNERDNSLKEALKNNSGYDKITLAIGPEGGITSKEEQWLETKSFKKITLGSQIMRVETVPIFLASVIKYEFME